MVARAISTLVAIPPQLRSRAVGHIIERENAMPLPTTIQSLPIGLREDASLNPAQFASLQRLADFDLSDIHARILRDVSLPPSTIDSIIFEFRRYIALYAVTGHQFTMFSHQVDVVWHTC